MAVVKFYPYKISIDVEIGTTILEAARLADVVVESPCNGVGICGKCRVKLDKNSLKNVVSSGKHNLSEEEKAEGIVVACETKINGDILVWISDKEQKESLKILGHGKSFHIEIDNFIRKEYTPSENITNIYADDNLVGVEKGNTENQNYGVVVDIGTTTLVTSLIDVALGKEIASTSSLNPQSVYAQDILSRIKFASDEKGLNTMYSEIIKEIDRMINEIADNHDINSENIYEVVFSGNTCMLHLAANVNPTSLGKYPYIPQITGGEHLKASDHNLNISPFGVIYLPKIISAYVGADITSGILASRLHDEKEVTLFIDIGTNGEMALAFNGELSAASTAAGPAFEGMNISCGMRAANGAIELFNIEEDNSIAINTIGDCEATGICGSGLIDIVGELVYSKVINGSGKFDSNEALPESIKSNVVKNQGKTVFKLNENVYLSQKDVRQVQLAKGAIRTGIEFLLKSKDLKAEDVDKVLIAGSFGYHLRAKSLINIGLLPKEFENKIEFIGNTSKSGGHAFLLNKSYRKEMDNLVKNIDVIELANYEDFDKVFVQQLKF